MSHRALDTLKREQSGSSVEFPFNTRTALTHKVITTHKVVHVQRMRRVLFDLDEEAECSLRLLRLFVKFRELGLVLRDEIVTRLHERVDLVLKRLVRGVILVVELFPLLADPGRKRRDSR